MIHFRHNTGLWFVAALIAIGSIAQSDAAMASEDRPRIGLVLSGGGARGAAHIGVLEVLEELRVPVDVVVGTSMGSVVGGLYALGLSPAELETAIEEIDWVQVFADEAPRQERSFRRKEDDFGFLTSLKLSIKDGSIFVPSGAIRGQKLEFALQKLTLTSTRTARFDDLRLPFRAVATDIASGEPTILGKGSLVTALRASMSIPAVLAPVEIDGRALVDGGIVMNMPIEIAQEMGAEVLIVVDVATPLRSPQELESALSISAQVITIQAQQNQKDQLERLGGEDIVIAPALGELGTASFQSLGEAIRIGGVATLEKVAQLESLALSEEAFARWRSTQRREPVELPVIDRIRIEGQTKLAASALRARVATAVGSQLDLTVLEHDLDRLYGTGAVQYARFDLESEGSETVLTIRVADRDRGQHALRFGLALDADLADQATFNLGVQHLWFPANRLGGEVRTSAQIGRESGLRSEWYQPVDSAGQFFLAPVVEYNVGDLDTFNGSDRLARADVRTAVGFVELGVNLLNVAQVRAGIGYLHVETDLTTGAPGQFSDRRFGGGLVSARFLYDHLDDLSFPNDGSLLGVTATLFPESLGWKDQFATIEGALASFRTYSRTTVGFIANYATTIDANDQPQTVLARGGLFDLGAFRRLERSGAHSGLLSLNVYRRVSSPTILAFEFPLYLGIAGEVGGAWEERSDVFEEIDYAVTPFIGLDTPLGPLFVAYSYGSGNRQRGYVRLGRSF